MEPEAEKWNGSEKQRCGHLGIGECIIVIDHGSESESVCLCVSVSVSLRMRSEVGIFLPDRRIGYMEKPSSFWFSKIIHGLGLSTGRVGSGQFGFGLKPNPIHLSRVDES